MPPLVPLIDITLDRPRHLLFDRAAVKRSEVELSRAWNKEYSFFSALHGLAMLLATSDPAKLSFTTLSILVWQGCLHEDPQLTLAAVEDAMPYLDVRAMVGYAGKILEAWQAVSPPPVTPDAEEAAQQQDPLDGSTGAASGPLSAYASV